MARRNLATIDRNTWQPSMRLIQEAMAHGITNDLVFGGLLAGQTELQGIHTVGQTTQNCLISTRRVTWDGRVFRYSLSTARCETFTANTFDGAIGTGASHVGIDWSTLPVSAAIGDTSISMTEQSGLRAIAEDELYGGLLTLNVSSGENNHNMQLRRITGNTACAASGVTVISFAEPLVRALTASTAYGYCMPSPYSAVRDSNQETGKVSFCGYAGGEVDVTGKYHWEQTWGMVAASLYGDVGKTQWFREVVFRYDGNLIHRGASGVLGLEAQTAGYIMDNNGGDNGATMIMLQLDK